MVIKAVHNSVMRYQSTLHKRILEYSDAMFFYFLFFLFFFIYLFWFFFVDFFDFFFVVPPPYHWYRSSVAENACNFTSSCSWRRRFNNNNNSKQCCFKNQRWQNNPFSSKSKQKSRHLVPVSEWWVWQCLSLETFLPTAPCHRPPLTQARVSVGLDRLIFFCFFCGRIFGYEKSYPSSCQPCGYSSIRLHVAALMVIRSGS